MAIFGIFGVDGIKVGIKAILPKEKYNPSKTRYYEDPDSPIMSSGGCSYYDLLDTRYVAGPSGDWEAA